MSTINPSCGEHLNFNGWRSINRCHPIGNTNIQIPQPSAIPYPMAIGASTVDEIAPMLDGGTINSSARIDRLRLNLSLVEFEFIDAIESECCVLNLIPN